MINTVVLVGRLTRDPELRRTPSGTSVCTFTIAVNRRIKSPGQPEADFPSCTAWGRQAEVLCQFMRKGGLIGVTGRIQTRSFDDANGQRQYRTDVVAEHIDFLESRAARDSHGQGQQGGYGYDGGYQDNGYGQGGYGQNYGGGNYSQGYNSNSQYGNQGYQSGSYNNRNQNTGYGSGGYSSGGYGQSSGAFTGYQNKQEVPASSGSAAEGAPGASSYQNRTAGTDSSIDAADALSDSDDLDIATDDLPF